MIVMFLSFEEVLRFQGNKGFEVSRFQGYEVSRNQESKFLGFRGFRGVKYFALPKKDFAIQKRNLHA
jgi:hypothetical protein